MKIWLRRLLNLFAFVAAFEVTGTPWIRVISLTATYEFSSWVVYGAVFFQAKSTKSEQIKQISTVKFSLTCDISLSLDYEADAGLVVL